MERLDDTPELLDGPLDDALLAGNMRDLARINRYLGGASISHRALRSVVGADGSIGALRLLDVGTGAADIPASLLASTQHLDITAIDSRGEIVGLAQRVQAGTAGLRIELADGSALPWAEGAFDIVHASLVLHHLGPRAAVSLLREMARVARIGVIINDLERTRHGWLGAWLLLHGMSRNRYTLHDGPLSVRRAWRAAEVVDMAATVGLVPVARHDALFRHRYAIAFRHAMAVG